MHPELLKLLGRFANVQALADKAMAESGESEAAKGKAAAVKAAAEAATKALEDLMKAFQGGDVDAVFAAVEATKAVIDQYENAVAAMTGAPADQDGATPPPAAPATEDEATKSVRISLASITGSKDVSEALRAIEGWKTLALEHKQATEKLAQEKRALESTERRHLVGELVKLGRETPATAWANKEATEPKGYLASMPIQELRDRVAAFGGSPSSQNVTTPAPTPPSGGVAMSDQCEISEAEVVKCRMALARSNEYLKSLGNSAPWARPVSEDECVEKYRSIKLRQGKREMGTRRVDFLRAYDRKEIVFLSTGVQPIQDFGATSQIALINWRLEYNTSLASQPRVWAETLGDVLPGNSLKDDYPIALDALKYLEKKTEAAGARTTTVKDITVTKREFLAAAEAELRRILYGDFAYIQTWQRKAESMARARTFLRNNIVADLIVTGTNATTCQLDGQAFFSATHKVNPSDATIKTKNGGSATWSNYQSAATPLSAANLTAEKAAFKATPGPDGQELGLEVTHVLVPTCLDEIGYQLMSVQDLILSGSLDGAGGGTMGTVRNPHFNSGLTKVRGPELPGTDSTADWYLLSATAFQMGLFPWVIAENSAEELTIWDETSDYFKDTRRIKVQSGVLLEAAFLYPHAIRKIKGS